MQFLTNQLNKIKGGKWWKAQAFDLLKLIEEQEILFSVEPGMYDPNEYDDEADFGQWRFHMAAAIATAHRSPVFLCVACGETKEKDVHGTGYALRHYNGPKICYECIGKEDEIRFLDMKPGERDILYLTPRTKEEIQNGATDRYTVTNWPGTFRRPVYNFSVGRHNIAGHRIDVWFSVQGNRFHGVQYGNDSQICHVRCLGPVPPNRYKVVKVGRKSGRRQILRRNLTEDEARRVVAQYPDSSRSMVIYQKH